MALSRAPQTSPPLSFHHDNVTVIMLALCAMLSFWLLLLARHHPACLPLALPIVRRWGVNLVRSAWCWHVRRHRPATPPRLDAHTTDSLAKVSIADTALSQMFLLSPRGVAAHHDGPVVLHLPCVA
jgi:hypothetical protein